MKSNIYELLINASIRFVSYRPRSEKEFRDFLARTLKKNQTYADPAVMEQVIARMRDLGYLDDRKFAAWWVEQRVAFRPKGKRLIASELKGKGINVAFEYDEIGAAKKAIEKKIDGWERYPYIAQKKKASDFLFRRGFDWDTISRVVDEVVAKVVK